ncbi:MAG TPA: hypothetical protein VF332_10310 [Vicinamibacterales bacterium]
MSPALARHRVVRPLAAVGGFALITVLLTSPLAWRAAEAGPVNTGDGQFSIWNVSWVARALVADPLHVYDANIFAPHRGTLAYSEANLPAGVLAVPAWWLSRNPYLAYNAAVFLSILLAGLATLALGRWLTSSTPAAVVSAIVFAFAPFVIVRYAHIQLLMTVGLPLTLLAMHRFVERPGAWRAVAVSLAIALAGLGCGYYGFFAALSAGLGFIYYGIRRRAWREARYPALCAVAAVGAGLAILPFFVPYLGLLQQHDPFRTLGDARQYSADWQAYLSSTTHLHRALLGLAVPFDHARYPERVLFPGVVAVVLAGVALAGSVARGFPGRPALSAVEGPAVEGGPGLTTREREAVGFYAVLAVVAGWLSFGPDAGLYTLAYRTIPAWSLLRAPARFGILAGLAVAVLAAIGLAALLRRAKRPALVAAVIGVVAVAELSAVPWDLRDGVPVPQPYRLLARLPAGAVAEFPFFFRPVDFHRHALYMLYSTAHWHPLVNGYSDYVPDDFKQMVIPVSSFPASEALGILRAHGTRYVVFHMELYDSRSREKLLGQIERYREYIRPLAQEGQVWLYEIVKGTAG